MWRRGGGESRSLLHTRPPSCLTQKNPQRAEILRLKSARRAGWLTEEEFELELKKVWFPLAPSAAPLPFLRFAALPLLSPTPKIESACTTPECTLVATFLRHPRSYNQEGSPPLSTPKASTSTLFLIPHTRSPLSDNQVIQLHNGSSADEPQPAYSFEEIVKSSEDREMMEVRFSFLPRFHHTPLAHVKK
jgi:hypothetical protein